MREYLAGAQARLRAQPGSTSGEHGNSADLLLREAIFNSAFDLHYPPQVRLADGALQGIEALVRWRHPERGLVGPDEFITFSESRGLTTPIGRWVMREACRQLKEWQDQGLAMVPVAVNLSAIEFCQRDGAAIVKAIIQMRHRRRWGC